MNPNTGAIAAFETEEDARKAGFTMGLSPEQIQALMGLDRPERLRVMNAQQLEPIQSDAPPAPPVQHRRHFKVRRKVSR